MPELLERRVGDMKKFICTADVVIEAEDEDDARIELLIKMDDHDIYWDVEEEELGPIQI